MTNGRRGRDAEWKARDELAAQGFLVVRSAGSLGPFDLAAFSVANVRLVQVKREKRRPRGYAETRRDLVGFRAPPGCTKELWVWRDRRGWRLRETVP